MISLELAARQVMRLASADPKAWGFAPAEYRQELAQTASTAENLDHLRRVIDDYLSEARELPSVSELLNMLRNSRPEAPRHANGVCGYCDGIGWTREWGVGNGITGRFERMADEATARDAVARSVRRDIYPVSRMRRCVCRPSAA